jgi:hypothetical protein
MTETMLVRAARAIVRAEQDEWDTPASEWTLEALEIHGPMTQARAALQAIREVDEETVVALVTAPVDFGDHSGGNLVSSWRAAIDSILSQSQEGNHP